MQLQLLSSRLNRCESEGGEGSPRTPSSEPGREATQRAWAACSSGMGEQLDGDRLSKEQCTW